MRLELVSGEAHTSERRHHPFVERNGGRRAGRLNMQGGQGGSVEGGGRMGGWGGGVGGVT